MGTNQPRNYQRRYNDGGNEIDGKDATTVEQCPASSPSTVAPLSQDGSSYTQEQEQQSFKDVVKQSWNLGLDGEGEYEGIEIEFNGEPLRSIGMNGLFHVFYPMMPHSDDDKKASFDIISKAYDEEVNLWNEHPFRKSVGYEGSHRTVSSNGIGVPLHPNQQPLPQEQPQMYAYDHAGIPLASMPIVSVPSTSVDDALPESQQDKYVFMQELRDFNSALRYFMQEKGSLIKEMEDQMKEINEKHALAILERRTADDDDEMVELGAAVKAAMAVLNKQGNSNSAIAAATSAASVASSSIRQQTKQPVQLHEFGRDENLQKRREVEQQKRRARFESSTDESESEPSAYKETRDSLLQCADKVLTDASEVYSQLSRVKTRFKKRKRDYSSAYRDAYMSLTVPSIYSPYVRLELLKWDPLHQDVDFSNMNWHGLLFDYGTPYDFSRYCTDANLVSELVEKVVIPILHHRIVRCWDILSTRETRNAVAATSLVASYVYASSEALAKLFAAIHARLVEAITAISVPTWGPLVLKAVPNAPQVAAYRFGTSVRLMRNICMWKDILELPVLENLALSDLLFGKILPHVRSIASISNMDDAVTRTERIVASLSGVWTGPSVTRTHSRLLQPLVDCTLTLERILEKRLASGLDDTETTGLARRLKRILVELHEHELAREIVRAFNLKEAV